MDFVFKADPEEEGEGEDDVEETLVGDGEDYEDGGEGEEDDH